MVTSENERDIERIILEVRRVKTSGNRASAVTIPSGEVGSCRVLRERRRKGVAIQFNRYMRYTVSMLLHQRFIAIRCNPVRIATLSYKNGSQMFSQVDRVLASVLPFVATLLHLCLVRTVSRADSGPPVSIAFAFLSFSEHALFFVF